jgi:nicotinamide riboside transporter PnuC
MSVFSAFNRQTVLLVLYVFFDYFNWSKQKFMAAQIIQFCVRRLTGTLRAKMIVITMIQSTDVNRVLFKYSGTSKI